MRPYHGQEQGHHQDAPGHYEGSYKVVHHFPFLLPMTFENCLIPKAAAIATPRAPLYQSGVLFSTANPSPT